VRIVLSVHGATDPSETVFDIGRRGKRCRPIYLCD